MDKYIIALDQGTTSTRAIIFDSLGKAIASSSESFGQIYPKPGWVEHNPDEIFDTAVSVIKKAMQSACLTAQQIDSIGITNQRETSVVWDKESGKCIYNAIVWQCRRTAESCLQLKKEGCDELVYKKTGLVIDAYFSATKLKWILDNVEGARQRANDGKLCFGTIDTYLMWRLSGGKIFATDFTNASRTMLFNIHTLKFDDELLKLFDIPASVLPEVLPSSHIYGTTQKQLFGGEIKIAGVAGDQQASLLGHLCIQKGSVKNTYGTGCFLLMNTGDTAIESKRGLITTLAASGASKPDYCLEGSIFIGGALVQWLRDEMGLIKNAAESEQLAFSVDDTGGVYFVPAFVGLGAPRWDSNARGLICGLTRGTTRAHIVRAALEAIAYEVFDVLHAMERDVNIKINRLDVDGGACANNFLMQFEADILNAEVVRPAFLEATALGACYLAGLATGYFKSIDSLKKISTFDKIFSPALDDKKRNDLIIGWETAVARARVR